MVFIWASFHKWGKRTSKSGNIDVTQKQGLGANGYIGLTWLDNDNNANSVRSRMNIGI